jgi:HEPN domain-containing protein
MAEDRSRTLLNKAFEELETLDVLLLQEGVATWIFGFHAQQVAEKSLKAVLFLNGQSPPERTHDLVRLFQRLLDSGTRPPDWVPELSELTSFAVELRYETDDPEEDLDRRQTRDLVVRIYNWAASIAGRGGTRSSLP